jgi:hypothetical protein
MNKACVAVISAAAAMAMGMDRAYAVSASVLVDTSPSHNKGWMTVRTNEVSLTWNWVANATRAQLAIVGMNGSVVTNFSEVTASWLWRPFDSGSPSAEDVYDLTLTFYTNGTLVAGVLTSRLAVVTGAFGPVVVDPGPATRTWGKVGNNAVIPYDAGWTNVAADAATTRLVIARADGMTRTNTLADASGYYAWELKQSDWGYGTFNLALTFPVTNVAWDAILTRPLDGTVIRMQ